MKIITIDGNVHLYNSRRGLLKILKKYPNVTFGKKFGIGNHFKCGKNFKAGDLFDCEDRFHCKDNFKAGNSFYCKNNFTCGKNFKAGRFFDCYDNFKAGDDFEAGDLFDCGDNFTCGDNFKARNNFYVAEFISIDQKVAYAYKELNTNTWYIQLDCYLRTLEEWGSNDFPFEDRLEALNQLKAFIATYTHPEPHTVKKSDEELLLDSIEESAKILTSRLKLVDDIFEQKKHYLLIDNKDTRQSFKEGVWATLQYMKTKILNK